jgi:hypothetical protein
VSSLWPYGAQVGEFSPYGHLRRVTTPDAVLIHFNLLMMSKIARNM